MKYYVSLSKDRKTSDPSLGGRSTEFPGLGRIDENGDWAWFCGAPIWDWYDAPSRVSHCSEVSIEEILENPQWFKPEYYTGLLELLI